MGAGRDLYGLRNDGIEFPVEIGLSPLVTDEGSFVLASVVDISKRKKMEEKIHHSSNAIQQKNKEMEQFVYTVSHDLKSPLVTSADHKRIYQVFENLIINALKYACDGPNPKIEFGSRQTVDEFQFFVKDYGPGIAPEYHEKIFGLFQRLDNDNKGIGIGLAIVAKIMQNHQGRVWVESEVNEGAYFWVAFPKTISIYTEE